MKAKNLIKVLIVFALLTATFESCKKDDDNSVSVADRDKFLGTWATQSNGTSGPLNFSMTITAGSSDAGQIIISNFDLEGTNTHTIGEISGTSISISQQLVGSANDTIQGTGTYNSNNTLSFNYTVKNGTVDVRSATAHK